MTIRDQLITALTARGWKPVDSRSTKYVVMGSQNLQGETVYFYIGKSGGLRKGRTLAGSVSAERERAILLRPVKPKPVESTGEAVA